MGWQLSPVYVAAFPWTGWQHSLEYAPALNKKWAKDVVKDIEDDNSANILKNISRFLKDYITPEDNELDIKTLLTKYSDEIAKLLKYEKETNVFGFYNAWWVFGEVAKESEIDYAIFMAEAENVGYKRTKRGENPMPNQRPLRS